MEKIKKFGEQIVKLDSHMNKDLSQKYMIISQKSAHTSKLSFLVKGSCLFLSGADAGVSKTSPINYKPEQFALHCKIKS